MPGARTGIWCSVSWRSCSPTGTPADSLGLVFPDGLRRHSRRTGAHTATVRLGAWRVREVSPKVRILYAKFLTLSKNAYTKFYAGPDGARRAGLGHPHAFSLFIAPHILSYFRAPKKLCLFRPQAALGSGVSPASAQKISLRYACPSMSRQAGKNVHFCYACGVSRPLKKKTSL